MSNERSHGNPDHLVVLYGEDERLLAYHVSRFIGDALIAGGASVIVATQSHMVLFRAALASRGIDADAVVNEGRLLTLDAQQTLDEICAGVSPQLSRFDSIVGEKIEALAKRYTVHAYGEMVGMLWERGMEDDAITLEQHWNALRARLPYSLLCAYPIDVFGKDFAGERIHRIMCSHGELVSAHPRLKEKLDTALDQVLKRSAKEARILMQSHRESVEWGTLPEPEATILWLRRHLPHYADDIVSRVREYFSSGQEPA